jgi:hypothetical protein
MIAQRLFDFFTTTYHNDVEGNRSHTNAQTLSYLWYLNALVAALLTFIFISAQSSENGRQVICGLDLDDVPTIDLWSSGPRTVASSTLYQWHLNALVAAISAFGFISARPSENACLGFTYGVGLDDV